MSPTSLEASIADFVSSLSLQQSLNAVMTMQTFLNESTQARADFLSRWGEQSRSENGTYLAYLIREDAIKRATVAMCESIVARWGGEVAQ